MFLTRIPLNHRRRGAGKLLAYPQAMHAAVESCFPPGSFTSPKSGRALWRVDSPMADENILYVVSPIEPDPTHIIEQAGWQTGEMWQTRDYSPVLKHLATGNRYAFRLRANPVFSGRSDPSAQTKPRAHVTAEHQQRWLVERAQAHGFALLNGHDGEPQLRIVERRTLKFGKDRHKITIGVATYEGVMEVTDVVALRSALCTGIGRAKAYGCGLLTLAPSA